jgi:hypothetical protein
VRNCDKAPTPKKGDCAGSPRHRIYPKARLRGLTAEPVGVAMHGWRSQRANVIAIANNCGPLPQLAQRFAIFKNSAVHVFSGAGSPEREAVHTRNGNGKFKYRVRVTAYPSRPDDRGYDRDRVQRLSAPPSPHAADRRASLKSALAALQRSTQTYP